MFQFAQAGTIIQIIIREVKSLDKSFLKHGDSVGLNSALLLNIPVDKRGLIHENDSLRLSELAKFLKSTFSKNLALEGKISTSSNNVKNYKKHINDNDTNTYWSSGNGDDKCKIEINFNKPINANVLKYKLPGLDHLILNLK